MQRCAIHQGLKDIGWDLSWYRYCLAHHKVKGKANFARLEVSTLWHRPGNIQSSVLLPTTIGYSSNTNWTRRFRCHENNTDFMRVQPRYNYVRLEEP